MTTPNEQKLLQAYIDDADARLGFTTDLIDWLEALEKLYGIKVDDLEEAQNRMAER
jgi:hypothetical protein